MLKIAFKYLLSLFMVPVIGLSQSLRDCEAMFVKNNLMLLAGEYDIKAADALVVQAGIWQLPVAEAEINAYNPGAQKVFDAGKAGQKTLEINQLIHMGGKKKHEVDWASAEAGLRRTEFQELLVNLRYELRVAYVKLYFTEAKIEMVHNQALKLDTLIVSYGVQAKKNNLSFKDLYRLQSLQLRINEYLRQLRMERTELQNKLKILCGTSNQIQVQFKPSEFNRNRRVMTDKSLDSLKQIAAKNSPALAVAKKEMQSDSMYLVWQRSLNTPDISIGLGYDQRGGAFDNQIGVKLQVPLRLWSVNRGNVMMSEMKLNATQYLFEESKKRVLSEIDNQVDAYRNAERNLQVQNSIDLNLYQEVFEGMMSNFVKGNIGILEFIDFMESYSDTINQMNENLLNLYVIGEEINKTTGLNVYNQ